MLLRSSNELIRLIHNGFKLSYLQLFLIMFSMVITFDYSHSLLQFDINGVESSKDLWSEQCSGNGSIINSCSRYSDCRSCVVASEGNSDCIWTGSRCCPSQYRLRSNDHNITFYCIVATYDGSPFVGDQLIVMRYEIPDHLENLPGSISYSVRVDRNLGPEIQGRVVSGHELADKLISCFFSFVGPIRESDAVVNRIGFHLDYIKRPTLSNSVLLIGVNEVTVHLPCHMDKIIPYLLIRGHPSRISVISSQPRDFEHTRLIITNINCYHHMDNQFICYPSDSRFTRLAVIVSDLLGTMTNRDNAGNISEMPSNLSVMPKNVFPKINNSLIITNTNLIPFYDTKISFVDQNNYSVNYSTSLSCSKYDYYIECPHPQFDLFDISQINFTQGFSLSIILESHGFPFTEQQNRNFNLIYTIRPDPVVTAAQFTLDNTTIFIRNLHPDYEYTIEFNTDHGSEGCLKTKLTIINETDSEIYCEIDRTATHQIIETAFIVVEGYRILIARGSGFSLTKLHLVLIFLFSLICGSMTIALLRYFQKLKKISAKGLNRIIKFDSQLTFFNEPRKGITKDQFYKDVKST